MLAGYRLLNAYRMPFFKYFASLVKPFLHSFQNSKPMILFLATKLEIALGQLVFNYIFICSNSTIETCSKLTIKTPDRRHRRRTVVFSVTLEQVSLLFLVFLFLVLNK